MPLHKGYSEDAIKKNIQMESKTKPHMQAVAIALAMARQQKKGKS